MNEFDESRESRLWALGRKLRRLKAVDVDYENEAQERAYYEVAHEIVEHVISTPARTLTGLRVKAEAVEWCNAGPIDLGPTPSTSDRLVASIVDDLLAA